MYAFLPYYLSQFENDSFSRLLYRTAFQNYEIAYSLLIDSRKSEIISTIAQIENLNRIENTEFLVS